MAHCYICGNPIVDSKVRLRRKVRTGFNERRSYATGKVVSFQAHYGQRVVCAFCARRVDRERRLREHRDLLIVVAALTALAIALMLLDFAY